MKHLNQWAEGKPQNVVMMAQQLAVSAEACFQMLKLIKVGEKIEALSRRVGGQVFNFDIFVFPSLINPLTIPYTPPVFAKTKSPDRSQGFSVTGLASPRGFEPLLPA